MTYDVDNKNNIVDLKNAIQFQSDDTVNVVDLEADSLADIKKDYVGKYIAQCDICGQLVYIEDKDLEKIETCPYCGFDHCFYLIGQVVAIPQEVYVDDMKDKEDETLYDVKELVYGKAANNEVNKVK